MASAQELITAKNNMLGTNQNATMGTMVGTPNNYATMGTMLGSPSNSGPTLYGNNNTLPDANQQTPNTFQNANTQAYVGTNYDKLALNDISSGYKNQIGSALNNSQYHDITTNKVGMDNTPYTNTINNAMNNSTPTGYQSAIQSALDKYNGVTPSVAQPSAISNTQSSVPSLRDIYNNSQSNSEYLGNLQKYYPGEYEQVLSLRKQAENAVVNNQDTSGLSNQYQNMLDGKQSNPTSTQMQNNSINDKITYQDKNGYKEISVPDIVVDDNTSQADIEKIQQQYAAKYGNNIGLKIKYKNGTGDVSEQYLQNLANKFITSNNGIGTTSGFSSGNNALSQNQLPTPSQVTSGNNVDSLKNNAINPTDKKTFEDKINSLNSNIVNPTDQKTFEDKINALYQNTTNPTDSASFVKNMTDSINSMYDTQKNNVGLYYQTGIDQAKQQYAGLRNQASVADQQNLNKLKEAMAQQGLFNSGDNITGQTAVNNQYANDLSGYNSQEQNYYNDVNNQIAQKKAEYDAQKAQAMMDLGYRADDRSFKLANLQDIRNQQSVNNAMAIDNRGFNLANLQDNRNQQAVNNAMNLDNRDFKLANLQDTRDQNAFNNSMSKDASNINWAQLQNTKDQQAFNNNISSEDLNIRKTNLTDSQKQQAFQNAMTAINAQYGMNQDQFNNTLKGTTTAYGMGRDNVSDQRYNNDTAMQADQINYGRNQDQFNNTLKAVAQQYGMDEDKVNNLLKYAQFNASQDQRQFDNSTKANDSNYNIYNNSVKNDQAQQGINLQDRNSQWSNSQWAQEFTEKNKQYQEQFDYKKQQDAIAQQLAAARASSGGSGRSGGSSGSSKSSSSNSKYAQYADDAAALKAMGYNTSFINASMPTWNYEDSPAYIYSGGR